MTSLFPVILAGGGGTRLWPLSRELYPKQFLSFNDEDSMLQLTLKRLEGLGSDQEILRPLVLCNEEHRFLVEEHASQIDVELESIVLEPAGRNTAPALTIAALSVKETDPIMLMMPADHLIENIAGFQDAVKTGGKLAQQGMLVTFGIKPTQPETGYGYIKTADRLTGGQDTGAYIIQEFVEKPDSVTAEKYLQSGEYLWNSGVFMMQASVWLQAIGKYRQDILTACTDAFAGGKHDGLFFRLDQEAFLSCPSDSIDYAVMEKVGGNKGHQAALVELNAGWSDIGSWSAVWDVNAKNQDKNVFLGDVIATETRNTLVLSRDRLIATVGCENMIIIETPDAILVGDRTKSQDVKHIVEKLKQDERKERLLHTKVYRPWGSYESIDSGERFQVKRLTVKPGKKLSLQLHHKRAEHWVVVSGVATVTCGDRTFKLKENESTFIPLGEKHRLENAEDVLLEVIEVQSGNYLGEDDIVRFEDDFGRHNEK